VYLKQSTAADVILGPFVDSTDGVTAETALTISQADIRLSKNGAAFAQTNSATGATHRENGNYLIPLDTTDTNTLGRLRVSVAESGALPCWMDFSVVPANVWDSMFSTDLLQVDVTQLLGTAWLTPATAGTPDVNVKQISGDATAADNCESFFDGTGYAGTGNTIPTVTTVGAVSGAVGSVTGAVGSVTGAVGSVTGNVGGNVVGSVASVTAAVAVTSNVKKNQALSSFTFMMTDSTTHAPKTGVAVTVTRSIDGGAFGAGSLSAVTEISNGMYRVDFAAADLNGNVIVLRAVGAASDDTFERIVTQP
jgi:hypothetical protein